MGLVQCTPSQVHHDNGHRQSKSHYRTKLLRLKFESKRLSFEFIF